MFVSLHFPALGEAFNPLAILADLTGVLLLAGQWIVAYDALSVYDINRAGLRQAGAPSRVLGRVDGGLRAAQVGALSNDAVAAGCLGEAIGLHLTLLLGVAASIWAEMLLASSPVCHVQRMPALPVEESA
jgi:hypothetical protein